MTSPPPEGDWTGPQPPAEGTEPRDTGGIGTRGLAAVAVLGILCAALAGFWLARQDGPPGNSSAEAGFARDMQTHHAQAVEMSFLIRDRSEDEDLRRMAFDIITSQQAQIGQMGAWLDLWDLPRTGDDPPMAWMQGADGSHGTHGSGSAGPSTMTGMASSEQMAALAAADGVEAERQFLTLMIAHHRGGVQMAQAALDRAKNAQVRSLAQAMVTAQRGEIATMETMLAERP